MSEEYVTSFVTFTKLADGLRTKISVCTISRLEELESGTRIIHDTFYVDVSEEIDRVEHVIGAKYVELAQYEKTLQDHEDGEDWKFR